jgi:pimeloyl-ACP methyl ester carboxylesterase
VIAEMQERVIAGRRLEIASIRTSEEREPIVMLHEGLGSISAWRDFPERLARATGRTAILYSRYGHGNSEPLDEARTPGYMHHEAEVVLPALLDALRLRAPVLFGHSDGASIALIFASRYPDRELALVLEAPHVFVEPKGVESIARVKEELASSQLIERLRRHHLDPEKTFWGWNDIWLHPSFQSWNIEQYVRSIAAPMLVIQGLDDEYGTLAQVDAIKAAAPQAETLILEQSGHSPHRTQTNAVLERTAAFLQNVD